MTTLRALARELERTIWARARASAAATEAAPRRLSSSRKASMKSPNWCANAKRDGIALAPIGAARTLAQIRPAPVELGISLARLNRIVAYEPDDMTIIAEAGLTLGALNARIAAHGQRLAVDPPHPELTTLGALIGGAQIGSAAALRGHRARPVDRRPLHRSSGAPDSWRRQRGQKCRGL